MASTTQEDPPVVVDELPGFFIVYSNGSIVRSSTFGSVPASQEFDVHGVASVDTHLHPSPHLWARIFLPQQIASSPPNALFPLVLHFHGGGMCFGSPSTIPFHSYCSRMAAKSQSIWISVNYRLAPEHRLPAAYDDAYESLNWLHSQACAQADGRGTHDWLSHADFSRCFITGESAGATITHFLAVRAAGKDWKPMKIRGLMLVHPGFFKELPVAKPFMDTSLSVEQVELLLRLSLPEGAECGHPFWNPFHPQSPKLSEVELPPLLVTVADRDVCYDGGLEYYDTLKKAGKDVELFNSEGKGHCFHFGDPEDAAAEPLTNSLVDFINHID